MIVTDRAWLRETSAKLRGLEALRLERNAALRVLHDGGASYRDLQEVTGLSLGALSKVLSPK